MKIGHLVIATNRYLEFVGPLLDSSKKFFLPNHEVTIFLFTNMPFCREGVVQVDQEHYPWPGMTLRRYEIFLKNRDLLSEMDYLFYTDADMLFVDTVGDEVLGDLVATIHPGYYNSPPEELPHEMNPRSTAFVPLSDRNRYFAGGFNGGKRDIFLGMAEKICEGIQEDRKIDYIAQWHDESHMNRYLIDHKPSVVLDPSYCFPKDNRLAIGHPYRDTMKLCALEKNHKEFQI